ncbi:hypothetical protein N7516_002474 [Penicillium verrucosum]|uniref:uncharacterized protein n=1 Tax=Penicillium verrucosum TaxID=60171 RepID=UPI00254526FB|nr:uncharacterized protein N7516_002474 [Penicillium verrucosum]KAJ5942306.1 hypothetical protein N7516_002474 [Penicillium verrucosum]
MDQYPIILRPEGGSRIIATGATGIICQNSCLPDQVIKAPLRYDLRNCDTETRATILHNQEHAQLCFEREKSIYRALPKNDNILDFITITDTSIHLPFLRLGNLREYLELYNKKIETETRERWVEMAVSAISSLHSTGVIHADISARNFLVANDLSIKLCDFSGSSIGDQLPLVEEEDRYRTTPDSPRSQATDIFALGCLIFEITTGIRPYNEIPDDEFERIEYLYSIGQYPCLRGNHYEAIIHKCWTSQYKDIGQLQHDLKERQQKILRQESRVLMAVAPAILFVAGALLISRRGKLWSLLYE